MTQLSDEEMATALNPDDRYTVRLLMLTGGESPEEAVAEYMQRIMDFGLSGFAFRVTDNLNDQTYLVQNGAVTTEEDLLAGLASMDEAEDEDGE